MSDASALVVPNARALEAMARAIAEAVAGPGTVEAVRFLPDLNWDEQPAYRFIYRFAQAKTQDKIGMIRAKVSLRLLDELERRGDRHDPLIETLDADDWAKHFGA